MPRLRIDLAYDGGGFAGWAAQPGQRTVEGELSAALATILRAPDPIRLTVAGRTDAGVHARGQVAPGRAFHARLRHLAASVEEHEWIARLEAQALERVLRLVVRQGDNRPRAEPLRDAEPVEIVRSHGTLRGSDR